VWIRTRSITGKLGKGTGNIRGGKLMIPYLWKTIESDVVEIIIACCGITRDQWSAMLPCQVVDAHIRLSLEDDGEWSGRYCGRMKHDLAAYCRCVKFGVIMRSYLSMWNTLAEERGRMRHTVGADNRMHKVRGQRWMMTRCWIGLLDYIAVSCLISYSPRTGVCYIIGFSSLLHH
jgi:hypothetical protein